MHNPYPEKYPCDRCEYEATSRGNLKAHIDGKHSDVVHSCEQCNYTTAWKAHLSKHVKNQHSNIE